MNMQIPESKLPASVARAERPSRAEAEQAVRTLLAWSGENPAREGLLETPKRVVDAYGELFGGYGDNVEKILSRTFGEVGGYNDMIIVRDIPFFSHCEHHMVPFFGTATIGYLPNGLVVGLSKLARTVEAFARRFQTQENLTAEIAGAIEKHLQPRGVAVVLQAEHMCMSMRGVQKQGATTVTHKFSGAFADNRGEQDRFYQMIQVC